MYRIAKRFDFSASHQLGHLPEHHPCARLHGHNYTVEVECEAFALDPDGMVVDYRELTGFRAFVDNALDHRHLNDELPRIVGCASDDPAAFSTAENLARILFGIAAAQLADHEHVTVAAVRVSETEKTWAEWRPACITGPAR